jgi:hypothetical protein
MKRDFTHENFEDFLKRSADGLRMKAPDRVWQNLSKDLNKRRRRTFFGLSAFLLISASMGYAVVANWFAPSAAETHTVSEERESTTAGKTGTFTPADDPVAAIDPNTPVQLPTNSRAAASNAATGNRPQARVIPLYPKQIRQGTETADQENTSTTTALPALTAEEEFMPTVVDSYTEFDATEQKPTATASIAKTEGLPWTIESVINSYRQRARAKKFETQFYFTPTVSYRKLSENKSYLRNVDPNTLPANYPALHSSVNSNVTHKPDIGFELGLTTKYALSSKLKVKGGVQFNINRYDIKAFTVTSTYATIAVNNGGRIDSIYSISAYSTEDGYRTNWLQNLSFQLSAPIGVEYRFAQNDKVSFGMGATIQPTYVLNDRSYLITTDYKHYTQVEGLARRWNVNTALETFVNINSGNTRWQVGPQVRYQLLSSFIDKYPVKENLFDFGLKVGVSLGK